ATVDLLLTSGTLERLSLTDGGEAPLALIVAVTKLDQPAEEMVVAAKQEGGLRLRWAQAYAVCARRARDLLRAQLDAALRDASVALATAATELPVFPVFPRDYQRLHRADPDEPSHVR